MCFKCMFYVDWELEGQKNFGVGIFLNKNLGVRVGLQETNNLFFRPKHILNLNHSDGAFAL